ncbi:MAG: hypothetical protein KDA45_15220 [Planctomycetales bacterium]|nr:hypothetical protein [Planctomycetales bacterium]
MIGIDRRLQSPPQPTASLPEVEAGRGKNTGTAGCLAGEEDSSLAAHTQEFLEKVRATIVAQPGTCVIIGLFAGAALGWLTSKLK